MSIHIEAKEGEIANSVLLPGDPLRAKFIAETFLEKAEPYNGIRGMLGFTGEYRGKRVSVQGSGMGMPSLSIYVNELINDYNVKNIIRVGSCGSIKKEIKIRDIILAMSSSSSSNINKLRFPGFSYAPTANYELLSKAHKCALELKIECKIGQILSSDLFYTDNTESWKKWAQFGILAVEMETAELYTLASKFGINALTILTVSDNIVTKETTGHRERERTFKDMMKIALETLNQIQ